MTFKDELLRLIGEDQAMREVLAATGELFHGYHPAIEKVHLKNANRLKEIIEFNKGFPTTSQVGEEACVAALRITLHAISWPEFMRAQVDPLLTLAKENKVPKPYVAMLVDRIRFYEGLKQVYATNADWDENGILRISEVEDPETLNQRRATMDLSPMQSLVITPEDGEYHPVDPAKRHQEFLAWTHKVGWRS
jgi:hypothetical protein